MVAAQALTTVLKGLGGAQFQRHGLSGIFGDSPSSGASRFGNRIRPLTSAMFDNAGNRDAAVHTTTADAVYAGLGPRGVGYSGEMRPRLRGRVQEQRRG